MPGYYQIFDNDMVRFFELLAKLKNIRDKTGIAFALERPTPLEYYQGFSIITKKESRYHD